MKINKKVKFKGKKINVIDFKTEFSELKIQHEMIEQGNAVAVLALQKDEIILVKEFRFPLGYVLEIPAGDVEKGETTLKAVKRELLEETGEIVKISEKIYQICCKKNKKNFFVSKNEESLQLIK